MPVDPETFAKFAAIGRWMYGARPEQAPPGTFLRVAHIQMHRDGRIDDICGRCEQAENRHVPDQHGTLHCFAVP